MPLSVPSPAGAKKTYRNENLITKAAEAHKAVEISLREQRGLLLVDHAIAMDFPVATGRSSHPTPKGSYKILEKKKDYASNLYGRMVSGDGSTVVSDADTRAHSVPVGGRFVGAPMPYWMRMTPTGVGMHVGHVPGHRPASHGCIRLKRETATELFALLDVGTPVKVDSFSAALGVRSVSIAWSSVKGPTNRSVRRPPQNVSPLLRPKVRLLRQRRPQIPPLRCPKLQRHPRPARQLSLRLSMEQLRHPHRSLLLLTLFRMLRSRRSYRQHLSSPRRRSPR